MLFPRKYYSLTVCIAMNTLSVILAAGAIFLLACVSGAIQVIPGI